MSRFASSNAADSWLVTESRGAVFSASGAWGHASGVIAPSCSAQGKGAFGRILRGRQTATPLLALLAPHTAGLEDASRFGIIDDAICAGLSRAGMHVARLRQLELAHSPEVNASEFAESYVDAVLDVSHAVSGKVPGARLVLAGSWLAGAVAASVAGRRDDIAMLALVSAPAPEVMSRRTAENEDDPMWTTSPSLRLADALAYAAPLEAIAVNRRPALIIQGAVDSALPATHLEAWRAALAAHGRPAHTIELAFTDELMRPVADDGSVDDQSADSLDMLADVIARCSVK